MLFDLTPGVILDKKNQKIYLYSRTALYFLALVFAFYAAITIIFPTRQFSFSFVNPKSTANTIVSPRDENGNLPDRGKIAAQNNFLFDATVLGNFSKAKVIFKLNKKSAEINNEKISIKKSYQAFLYPEGYSYDFPDGALLKYRENYYIVSVGELRKFKNKDILLSLGFNPNSFVEISDEDVEYQVRGLGYDIIDSNSYPNGSTFKINNDYFILLEDKLVKFISEKAYLSHFSAEQAIQKNAEFLQKYPKNENLIGFASGSLIAYGESAFVVSNKTAFPIDSVETFEAMGYKWEDLINVSGDEMSFYTKGDLLDLSGAHPEGTVFSASGKKYIIGDKMKHLLPSEKTSAFWSKTNPIEASSESLTKLSDCNFGQKWTFSNTYSCEIPIENLQNLLGKDYEFNVAFNEDIKVDSTELQFKKSFTILNLKRFVANVIKNIRNNYVGQQ